MYVKFSVVCVMIKRLQLWCLVGFFRLYFIILRKQQRKGIRKWQIKWLCP